MPITISEEQLYEINGNKLNFDAEMESNERGIISFYCIDYSDPDYGINIYLHIREPDKELPEDEEWFTVYMMEREVNDSAVEDYSREDIDMSEVDSLQSLKDLIYKSIQVRN